MSLAIWITQCFLVVVLLGFNMMVSTGCLQLLEILEISWNFLCKMSKIDRIVIVIKLGTRLLI